MLQRKTKRINFIYLGAMVFGPALIAFLIALYVIPEPAPKVVWSSAAGTPPPTEFRILMYPARDEVPLLDKPNGSKFATLTRAVANSYDEVRAGGWVRVETGGPIGWVQLTDLSFEAPPDMHERLVSAYVEHQRRWPDPTLEFGASVTIEPVVGGTTSIRFRRHDDDDHVVEFRWDLSNGVATPRSMLIEHGPMLGIAGAVRMLQALLAGGGGCVLGVGLLIGVRLVRPWLQGRSRSQREQLVSVQSRRSAEVGWRATRRGFNCATFHGFRSRTRCTRG